MRTLLWVAVMMLDVRISMWLRLNHPEADFKSVMSDAAGGAFGISAIASLILASLVFCVFMDVSDLLREVKQKP